MEPSVTALTREELFQRFSLVNVGRFIANSSRIYREFIAFRYYASSCVSTKNTLIGVSALTGRTAMANTGVRGRVIDESGAGIAGLLVAAYDVEAICGDVLLRNTGSSHDPLFPDYGVTDTNGNFELTYSKWSYGLEARPDIVVRVYDPVTRPLFEMREQSDVSSPVLELENITIPRAQAEGWFITQGTEPFVAPTAGNGIEYLVDNEEAWRRMALAVRAATTSINILLFYLDIKLSFMSFDPPTPPIGKPTTGLRLEEELLAANRDRKVAVRLAVNDFQLMPYPFDTAGKVQEYFEDASEHSVEVRLFSTPVRVPIHAKLIVIDNREAFLIGSPFLQEYYDGSRHSVKDARRGELSWSSAIRVPVHEVSARVTGPAVGGLNETFRAHWEAIRPSGAPELPLAPPPPSDANQNTAMQVARTLHGKGRFATVPHGETGILEGYLRAIRKAEEFIYLENQYVTCDEIADAIAIAMKRNTRLQVIMVINNKVDIPFYGNLFDLPFMTDGWQTDTIRRLLSSLGSTGRQRFELFTLWSHEPGGQDQPKARLIRNYVHTKAAVIDDKWATVGSANLDGVSLLTSEHALMLDWASPGDPREQRASEANVLLYNGVAGQPVSAAPEALRRRLWAEHLGFQNSSGGPNADDPSLVLTPGKDWVNFWRAISQERLASVKETQANPMTLVHKARVLPFPHTDEKVPRRLNNTEVYLKSLGVDPAKLDVEEKFPSFSFENGAWK
jgi:phosphatidylserine/phosphatidylglycerophosphate/cardiolipin synthase-like enzyme